MKTKSVEIVAVFVSLIGVIISILATVTTISENMSFWSSHSQPSSLNGTCSDSIRSNTNNLHSIKFYPVYVQYSYDNLYIIQKQFCPDAYLMINKYGEKIIQVAVFSDLEKANNFKKILEKRFENVQVGESVEIRLEQR